MRVEQTDGYAFWNSSQAADYPTSIEALGATFYLDGDFQHRVQIGSWMREKDWVPEKGNILDLGSASCSGLIFEEEVAKRRVTAVDYSQVLLSQNPVPESRKHLLDLRNPQFNFGREFVLVACIHLFRYLHPDEQERVIAASYKTLGYLGRLAVVDTPHLKSSELAEIMGEVAPFNQEEIVRMMGERGFKKLESGSALFKGQGIHPDLSEVVYATGVRL